MKKGKKCSYCSIELATEENGLCKKCATQKKLRPIKAWRWRLTKYYLFLFRHVSLCGSCVKRDVCRFYNDFIQEILIQGETKGTFATPMSVLWYRCDFFLNGKLPDRSIKVKRE